MERVLARVLGTFAAGFGVLGLVVGFLKTNSGEYCGSLFNHDDGCSQPAGMLLAVTLCWGLAVICLIAAIVADPQPSIHSTSPGSDLIDEPAERTQIDPRD